jgi:hypothetical protein
VTPSLSFPDNLNPTTPGRTMLMGCMQSERYIGCIVDEKNYRRETKAIESTSK